MQTDLSPANKRYNSIDIAKGICITFVMIAHYAWYESEKLKLLFPFWVDMAVPLFMVISGFVYTKSFQKNKISSLENAYTLHSIVKKIIRYSVPFAIAFTVEEVFYIVLENVHHTPAHILKTFIMGGFAPGSYYFPLMIQFVFYFPFIFVIIRKYKFKGVIICFFINLLYEVLKFSYGMNLECYRLLVFRYTLVIAYGCYLATEDHKRHKILSFLCFFLGLTYIIGYKYLDFTPIITSYWPATSMWACLYLIPIAAPLIINRAKNQVIETIGKASYDIFLVQMVYYNAHIRGGADIVYKLVENRVLQLVLGIVICVLIGLLFYYLETPLTKKIEKLTCNVLDRMIKPGATLENDRNRP